MTTYEFEREFDILYNSIMNNAAPSIDAYEKSVFLTKALEEIVIALYTGSFEANEQLTEGLHNLLTTKLYDRKKNDDSSGYAGTGLLMSPQSSLFEFPSDALFIVYESIIPDTTKGNEITVRPIRHDEYHRIKSNPFKKAREREALRLTHTLGGVVYLEIIYHIPEANYIYKVRYIRRPKPIILYDNDDDSPSIDNNTTRLECELNPMLHRTILEAAVKMAADIYKQQ